MRGGTEWLNETGQLQSEETLEDRAASSSVATSEKEHGLLFNSGVAWQTIENF